RVGAIENFGSSNSRCRRSVIRRENPVLFDNEFARIVCIVLAMDVNPSWNIVWTVKHSIAGDKAELSRSPIECDVLYSITVGMCPVVEWKSALQLSFDDVFLKPLDTNDVGSRISLFGNPQTQAHRRYHQRGNQPKERHGNQGLNQSETAVTEAHVTAPPGME